MLFVALFSKSAIEYTADTLVTQLLNGYVYFRTGSLRVPQGPHDTTQLPKMDFVGHMFTKQELQLFR